MANTDKARLIGRAIVNKTADNARESNGAEFRK